MFEDLDLQYYNYIELGSIAYISSSKLIDQQDEVWSLLKFGISYDELMV